MKRGGSQAAVGAGGEAEAGAGVGAVGGVGDVVVGVVAEGGVGVEVVFVAVEDDVGVLFDADFDLVVAQGRVARTGGQGCSAAGLHHQAEGDVGGEVHFVGDDVEEAGDF